MRMLLILAALALPGAAAALTCQAENGPGLDLNADGTVTTDLGDAKIAGSSVEGDILYMEIEDADGGPIWLEIDQTDGSLVYKTRDKEWKGSCK